jgi:uncharacterized protein YndB with AHSA1/START domain
MKYLKYLSYLVMALALVFVGKGLLTPEITYESNVTVDKPVEEAWAVMSDESRISEWLEGITKMENVSGTPHSVGAVSKIYFEENGEEMIMEETITALKPNEHIAMTFTMDFMNMDYEMFMTESNGNTQISTKSKTVGNGFFARCILSFMKSAMKDQEDINLDKLKKVINTNTKNYNPEPTVNFTDKTEKK